MQQPISYVIRVEGHVGDSWFEGMYVQHDPGGQTTISGAVLDQAALHGLLMRIRDLGLTLVEVQRVAVDDRKEDQP